MFLGKFSIDKINAHNASRENDVYAILDEINSLNFHEQFSEENDQSVADVVFRQGRSIGLNLISATQFLAKKGSKNKSLLFNQSATKIALHMSSASSTGVAKSIDNSKYAYYKEILENWFGVRASFTAVLNLLMAVSQTICRYR